MECVAGLTAFGAKTSFDYNRENFLYDRELRLSKELKILEFKMAQATLWRQDVRDLVSLTEYKMHAYLLVNVLMLASTVTLWCEGRLPPETPDWLMMGSSLSITGAFMFLLLSMWLAMHAAVAAQSYEARLLTQLVRLPIPSWQEIEACRTYASEFERTQGKQMFRVPFVMGPQEGLVKDAAEVAEQQHRPSAGSAGSPASGSSDEGGVAASAADPWGLERRGDDIEGLGCNAGSEVARLRHVKLTHQAMTYWQSYDAFARISLSVGTNQLLLALTYYMLGYILVEAGCRTAATYGVVLLVVLAEALARLDMSLKVWQLRAIQFLLAYGPMMSCIAAYHWSLSNFESVRLAEGLVISAFVAHGILLALIVLFCRIQPQNNGTLLPLAFRSVLYLDVFGWVKQGGAADSADRGRAWTFYRGGRDSPVAEPSRAFDAEPGDMEAYEDVEGGADIARPAVESIKYHGNRPVPRRPEDTAPADAVKDLRGLPGSPEAFGTANEGTSRFFNAPGWLPGSAGGGDADADENDNYVVTGHENEMPRVLPWRLFCTLAVALGTAWILAGVYHLLGVSDTWDMDIPFQVEHKVNESWEVGKDDGDLEIGELRTTGRSAPRHRAHAVHHAPLHHKAPVVAQARTAMQSKPSLLSMGSLIGHASPDHVVRPELVAASWPHPHLEPGGLSCDASGRNFVVTDGVSVYSAALDLRRPRLVFAETDCPAVLGEGLQDTAVACDSSGADMCSAMLLHRFGGRIAGCALGNSSSAQLARGFGVPDAWLERVRVATADGTARGPHGRSELPEVLAAGLGCEGSREGQEPWEAALDCAMVGTSHGRIVELKRHSKRDELVPSNFLSDTLQGYDGAPLDPGTLRAINARHVGVLRRQERGRQRIDLFDRELGGAPIGKLPLPAWVGAASSWCAGGGQLYILGRGVAPKIWQIQIPHELLM